MNCKKYLLNNFPLQLQLNFIDLYKVEVINRLDQNVNFWKEFSYIVGDEIIEENSLKHIDGKDSAEKFRIAENFYNAVINSERKDLLYSVILEFLDIVDKELYQCLCIEKWKNESLWSAFQKLLPILHKIREIFDVEKVVDILRQYSPELGEHYQPVIKRWKNKEIHNEYAQSLIIRTLCIMVDGATYHLLNAIYKSNATAKEVIESIFPSFESFYQKNIFEDRDGIIHFVYNGDNIADAIEDIMTNGNDSKHAYNLFFENISPYHLRPLQYENTADDPFNLFDYQEELVKKSVEGENTLICAPTGSGKTVMAAYIIREHIFELRKKHKKAKIVFVVPKVILVEQQTNQLQRFLGHCAEIKGLHGGSDEDLDLNSLISSVDIIVLTHGILAHAIDSRYCKDEGINQVSLDAFTMIILDEVHHTDEEHDYNKIMKEYHRSKYGDSNLDFNFPIRSMPQVIGLTAFLGSPKNSQKVDDMINFIVNKCANFDAISCSYYSPELFSKINNTTERTILAKNNDNLANKYYNYLESLIEGIETYFLAIDGILRFPEIFEGHSNFKKEEYKSWLSVTRSSTLKTVKLPPLSKIKAYDCLNYLDKLYEAYQCAQLFPTKDTTKLYLEDLGDKNGEELDKLVFEQRQKLGNEPCSESDIFKELVKCINEQFVKNPESKIIVFASQRLYCRLASEIIERYTGKEGVFISGANASSEDAGCTPTKQSEIIKKFRSGESRILFATTVADEGVDIAECNLVIKYNLVTDNIAHLQRKGRARRPDSESILITFEDRKEESEEKNAASIKKAEKAFEALEKLSSAIKREMFEKAIIECNKKRIEKEKRDSELKEKMSLKKANFEIYCSGCDNLITESKNLRLCSLAYHVPFDPKIWEKVEFSPYSLKRIKENRDKRLLGTICCKNVVEGRLCNFHLGTAANFKGVMIPCLGCQSIKIVEKSNGKIIKPMNQWKKYFANYFHPDNISANELIAMKRFEGQKDLDKHFEDLGKASLSSFQSLYAESESEDESEDESVDESDDVSEDKSEVESDDVSKDEFDDESDDGSDDESDDGSDDGSEDESVDESDDVSEDKSEVESDDVSEDKSEVESVDVSEDESIDGSEDESDDESEDEK